MKKLLFLLAMLFVFQFSYAQWSTSGSNVYYNSGYVGIGTASPIYPLTLSSATETGILTSYNGTSVYLSHGGWSMGAGKFGIGNGSIPTLVVNTVANGGAAIGNVGIGTTSPQANLHVFASSSPAVAIQDNSSVLRFIPSAGINYIESGTTLSSSSADIRFASMNGVTNWMAIQGSTGNVGIGTTNPQYTLDVNGTINLPNNTALSFNGGASQIYRNSGEGGIQFTGTGGQNTMFVKDDGSVGIGTADPDGYKLAVNGNIIAAGVQILPHGNWPDYVFKPSYNLPPLSEVKSYIDRNQHLPDMPSATTVEKEGQNIGEMNKLLLKKVEELTLYVIEKDHEMREMKDQNDTQTMVNKKLEDEIQTIKNQLKTLEDK